MEATRKEMHTNFESITSIVTSKVNSIRVERTLDAMFWKGIDDDGHCMGYERDLVNGGWSFVVVLDGGYKYRSYPLQKDTAVGLHGSIMVHLKKGVPAFAIGGEFQVFDEDYWVNIDKFHEELEEQLKVGDGVPF